MKKNILIFLSGTIFSIAVIFFSAYYCNHKRQGKPLIVPEVYGNIRILRPELSGQKWPRDQRCMLIEKNGEKIISMSFDEKTKLASVSYFREGELRFIADSLNKDSQTYSYGNTYKHIDYNCDGTFDYYKSDSTHNIFIEDTWLEVDKIEGIEAIVAGKEKGHIFVFDPEKGWVEKGE